MIDKEMATRKWAIDEQISPADCAAAPALIFASELVPFGEGPYARVLKEAEP